MRFKRFAEAAETIEEKSGNAMTTEVADLFLFTEDDAIEIVPRFVQGRIFPAHDSRKLNVGASLMRSAVSEATGVDEDDIKDDLVGVSDMGVLFDSYNIKDSSGQQRLGGNQLSVSEVYDMMTTVASTSGAGSQQEKIDHIVSVLSQCTPVEAKYITRLVLEEMRIGVGEGTVRKAISQAYGVEEDVVERAIMLTNDTGSVNRVAREGGAQDLRTIDLNVGEVPLKPMLAKSGELSAVFDEIGADELFCDYKYDGFRIQAHKCGDDVTVFTRRLEDVTDSLPDVVEEIRDSVEAEVAIIDGEAVGYESAAFENPRTYQETQKRIRRKYDIDEMVEEIPLRTHAFDLLYTGDEGLLIDEPLSTRWEKLEQICDSDIIAEHETVEAAKEIQSMSNLAENADHEGVMVKDPSSTYQPNSRGKRWLKLKPEGETIDAVVIGGEWGEGERSDFIDTFEIAVVDESSDELVSVGNVGTGFTEAQFKRLTNLFEDYIVSQDGHELQFQPKIIFEVKFEEVQPSPEFSSGYGLRFPKYIQRRETKSVEEADTLERLEDIAEQI